MQIASDQPKYLEYRIKAGDTLALIISRFYGAHSGTNEYARRISEIMTLNPHLPNPDRIMTGDILILTTASGPQMCMAEDGKRSSLLQSSITRAPSVLQNVPVDSDPDFYALSWLATHSNYLTIPGSTILGGQGNLLSGGNIGLVDKISDLYADYKAGKLTKGQYDSRRKQSLDMFRKNIGPFEKLLYGDKTPHEVIRIARGGGVPATSRIVENTQHLKKLAAVAKHGGIVLTGVGVAASCMQIADADSRLEKNGILVETVVSTVVGVGSSFLVGLFLVSNPVGWGTALVLATGSVATSYMVGKASRTAFDRSGTKVDLVEGFGIDNVCRK